MSNEEPKYQPMKAWLKGTETTTRVQKLSDGKYKDIYDGTVYTKEEIDIGGNG